MWFFKRDWRTNSQMVMREAARPRSSTVSIQSRIRRSPLLSRPLLPRILRQLPHDCPDCPTQGPPRQSPILPGSHQLREPVRDPCVPCDLCFSIPMKSRMTGHRLIPTAPNRSCASTRSVGGSATRRTRAMAAAKCLAITLILPLLIAQGILIR